MVSTFVSIPGYRISEELYKGSRTIVYRGVRETDLLPVVIKLLKNPYPSFSELLSFRNQYTIAKNLNSELIVQTYSLESYQNGYALVMEDFGGISLKDYFTSDQKRYIASSEEFLRIAIALCNALDILYHQRIIHKDIKPSNILINPLTKQVKLIDFSIASLLPRETQTLINPNVLEGTLAYISPEQTGRMNRGIDYRTDFYSLGVTFYDIFTGELPFQSNDPMELVHCHIAKLPPNLRERGKGKEIPQVMSDIVMKLMAKNAEDRYQSALGLKFDLENCLDQLQFCGRIKGFEIARRDVCDRFIIPDKLYGRETEILTLLQAFERVSLGATEMMLVAGFSGIGKTAVVNEVHKPIVRQRGYFIKGKYDQFQRNIPFSAFVQAFRDLMGQLLSESDAQIQQWKNKILEAVGENGQVIIEVIPELEKIIGEQVPATELTGTATQNRFNLLFQKFTQVFTSLEHPLVIFLDDLQWADSASLKLMQLLMADTGHLLLIGVYRDNEVAPAHPLMLTLSEIQKKQATINTITLAPLSQGQVNRLVADTLKCPESLAWTLSVLIYQKTQGNPFFATQFLKSLHQENLIQFDFESSCWQCDIVKVTTQAVTDDVVAFMAFQLRKLPQSTQNVLKLAACIGNQFDLATLAIVSSQSEFETAADLWKALQEGLILPLSDVYKFYVGQASQVVTQENQETVAYKFLHDRVQQAAYSLIPNDQKQATHLKIGQLLLQKTSLNDRGEKLFDIVNHFNVGQSLITQPSQRHELAQLNLAAGCKARVATAYSAALAYLITGIELLPSDRWQHEYQLSLALYEGATEAAYLSTDFERMEQLAETVLTHAHSWLDRVTTYQAKIQAYIAQNQHLEALQLAREVLNQLGMYLPEQPTEVEIKQGLQHTQTLLGNRAIESLLELPEMTAPEQKAAMTIISTIMSPAYQSAPNLLPLLIFVQVDLSVQYGNATESTFGYVQYGLILVAILKDIDAGYRFGQLGMNLLQRLDAPKMVAKTIFGFNASLAHWREPAKDTLTGYLQAYASGLETGDFEYAALSLMCYSYTAYFSGVQLSVLKQTMDEHRKVIQQFRQDGYFRIQSIYYQAVLNLLELTDQPDRLCSKDYDEDEMIQFHLQTNQLVVLYQIYFNKLLLSYLFHRYEQAVLNARLTEQYMGAAAELMHVPLFSFYDALVRLAIYPTVSHTEQAAILDKVSAHQEKLQEWASHAPSNQAHRWALVAAEQCRVLGEKVSATDLYDRAIALAKENDYIQEEALANELAAKFYLDWDKQRLAGEYITQAYYGYARWGAKAKVADLERRYPQLLAPILLQTRSSFSTNETIFSLGSVTSTSTSSATSSSSSVSVALDLAAILKAYQTISGEIELEKLLKALLHIVIENAGADKCVFMLLESDRLLIQALGKLSLSVVQKQAAKIDFYPMLLNPQSVEDSVDVPVGLINTVKRSLQPAVIVDATVHPQLINDPYIQQQQPKSILCSPILHQGKLLGVLYLENNLVTGAFTSDRVELLNLLCAQAAISLENSRLYERSLEYSQQLERSLEELSTAQSGLQASQQRLQLLVQQTPLAVIEWDTNYQVTDWNPAAERIFGYSKQEALGCGFKFIIPEIIQAEMERVSVEIVSQEGGNYSINENVTKDGKIIICAWYNNPLVNADGELIGVASLADDITEQQAALRERKVAEVQLQQKAQELETALQNLQQAQLQMVQSEKMSALGNLVAGVAHEMNNPLGFISASLKQAKPTIADIAEHLKLYQESSPNKSDEIIDHAEEIDLDYSLEDLPKMIDSMVMACDRLKSISTSLRTFSRADQDYKVPFNIHQGIDSTILILKHRLKANEQRPAIEVVTNYGNLPQVECFPGQLNQVFMNLLANAIDALDEFNHGRSFEEIQANRNCITITTSVENDLVKIAIADNGKGMNEEVKSKIFDYLFTTKGVGKGTGLGLAIAKAIVVEKHGGSIDCVSVPGQGTKFMIQLLVRH
ncbi:multi-sensor signal transduction multi-kinase [Tolypothrix sp. NIES-4075]|uniref:trifunctional serine/threonine-protein kinase/ATP-binding protein/sensor histidine kinase n=1 Tax=Tolypothrix sp. NIES-4075 TaxID=2005459 RepID=UPI000B5CF074|nr:AAA family ATPase [Tolypothrix sp. NIES-4075]GAX39650.1 multi-sensor signal transduction multi-kinase [Tolypothrix sp. NIES-4075]